MRHILLLSCSVCAFLATVVHSEHEEEKNVVSLASPPVWRKDQANADGDIDTRRHLRRRYRRPHIERVWIMRPGNNSNSKLNSNFSDPIRSFAVAIRDPETFVRYLRQEENQRLANYGRQNLTFYNKTLPSSRYVQMEILSQPESEEKVPIFNMIVEQDEKMDTNSFMDLMQQVAALPMHNSWNSNSNGEDNSVPELQQQKQKAWLQRRTLDINRHQQNYKNLPEQDQYKNRVQEQRVNERNIIEQKSQDDRSSNPELDLESDLRERKTEKRQGERIYRQRVRVTEPLLILEEFGRRNPNYSRPSTREFNRSKSHDILMAPSVYLLPPAVSTFRHFNLPQNVLSFTQTPVPKPRDRSSLRRRKKPRTYRPIDVSISPTDITRSSTYSQGVYSSINPPTDDVSLIPTDIPRLSTDISRQSTDISSSETDISQVHIDIPRIYTGISRSYNDASPRPAVTSRPITDSSPPFTDISRVHIAFPRQPVDSGSSVDSPVSTDNPMSVSSLDTDLHPPDLPHKSINVPHQSTGISHSAESVLESIDVSPPSTDISPPLLPTFTENPFPYSVLRRSQDIQNEFFVGNSPIPNEYPNELSTGGYGNSAAVTQEQPIYSDSSIQQSSKSTIRNSKNNFSSLMAIIVDMYGQKASDVDENYNAKKVQRRRQMRRRSKQQSDINRIHREDEYDELQLTAAETAYYKKRQLTRKPFAILETNEETGSIPGVPGRDYPIYNRPPKTNFACVKGRGGYFVDISTRCQVFFVCTDDGRGEPMLCPNGTLFNQDFLVCDWWFNVACDGVP